MCLAIYKPAGKSIPKDHLYEGFTSNPDGAGFAYVEDGRVMYAKGYFKYNDFLEAYEKLVKDDYPAVVHFRWATVGEKTVENCHPFPSGDGGVLVHNGPQIQKLGDDERSDSREFAERIMTPLSQQTVKLTKEILESYLGYNKVVMLYPDDVVILNEELGEWDGGIWYSNDGYKMSYSYGSWFNKFSEEKRAEAALVRERWERGEEDLYESELTAERLAAILEKLSPSMRDYVTKSVDLTDYFYDNDSGEFFFLDEDYEEYIELETGYGIEEFYSEILGMDITVNPAERDDPEAPVEGGKTFDDYLNGDKKPLALVPYKDILDEEWPRRKVN